MTSRSISTAPRPAISAATGSALWFLHRPDDAGRHVTISTPDGTRTGSAFPTEFSPHLPFLDIAAMAWEREGTTFRLEFSGDVFETEDQSNCTNASFKTHSTPLSRPFPVSVRAGDRVPQGLRLRAAPTSQAPTEKVTGLAPAEPADGVLTVRRQIQGRVPALRTSASQSAARLGLVPGLDALIVELPSDEAGAREILPHAE
jgi:hypothetical protein